MPEDRLSTEAAGNVSRGRLSVHCELFGKCTHTLCDNSLPRAGRPGRASHRGRGERAQRGEGAEGQTATRHHWLTGLGTCTHAWQAEPGPWPSLLSVSAAPIRSALAHCPPTAHPLPTAPALVWSGLFCSALLPACQFTSPDCHMVGAPFPSLLQLLISLWLPTTYDSQQFIVDLQRLRRRLIRLRSSVAHPSIGLFAPFRPSRPPHDALLHAGGHFRPPLTTAAGRRFGTSHHHSLRSSLHVTAHHLTVSILAST